MLDQFFAKIGAVVLVIQSIFGLGAPVARPNPLPTIQDIPSYYIEKESGPIELPAELFKQLIIKSVQDPEVRAAILAALPLGATIPIITADFETSLSASMTTTDTSMTLTKGTNKAGNALSGYMCFTIDTNATKQEYVCGTASSTSITGLLRGIDPVDGDLEVTSLKQTHRLGATVTITDHPGVSIALRILNGNETLPNLLKYATGTSACSDPDQICDREYINAVASSGAANADFVTKGLIEIATKEELASSTATGGTGAILVPQASYFSATSTATTTAMLTKTNGKASQGFWDLTESFTFTGTSTFSGGEFRSSVSSTFSATTTITNLITPYNQLIDATTTQATIHSTLATTTIYTIAIPADTIATSTQKGFKGKIFVSDYRTGGATGTSTISFVLGTSTISSYTATSSQMGYGLSIELLALPLSPTTQSFLITYSPIFGQSGPALSDANATTTTQTGTVNTSVANNLVFQVRHFRSDPGTVITTQGYIVERIQR